MTEVTQDETESTDGYAELVADQPAVKSFDQTAYDDLLHALLMEIRELRARIFGADRASTPTLDECAVAVGLEMIIDDEKALSGVRQTRVVKEVE